MLAIEDASRQCCQQSVRSLTTLESVLVVCSVVAAIQPGSTSLHFVAPVDCFAVTGDMSSSRHRGKQATE